MSFDSVRPFLLAVAGIGLPAGYLGTCAWLNTRDAWWFLYAAYFALFGTVGGFAFAVAMSPSGIAAVSSGFLAFVALPACLVSALVVSLRDKKGLPEWIVLVGGLIYPAGLAVTLVVTGVQKMLSS